MTKWWNEKTVAVVTGGNRGLGLSLVRLLAQKGLSVVLTARKEEDGRQVCNALRDHEGLHNVVAHQLDVQDPNSIAHLTRWLQEQYGGLDILINNAGIFGVIYDDEAMQKSNISVEQMLFDADARRKFLINDPELGCQCLDINYYGARRVTASMRPLFRNGARVVNVSSFAGLLKALPDECLRLQFANEETLTEEFVDRTIASFLADLRGGRIQTGGKWPDQIAAYTMSKIALNAHTRILARQLQHKNIYVNAVHPGMVKTELLRNVGELTPDQAADGVVWLALLDVEPPPSGQFFYLQKPVDF